MTFRLQYVLANIDCMMSLKEYLKKSIGCSLQSVREELITDIIVDSIIVDEGTHHNISNQGFVIEAKTKFLTIPRTKYLYRIDSPN